VPGMQPIFFFVPSPVQAPAPSQQQSEIQFMPQMAQMVQMPQNPQESMPPAPPQQQSEMQFMPQMAHSGVQYMPQMVQMVPMQQNPQESMHMWQPYAPQTNSDSDSTYPPTWQEDAQENTAFTAAELFGNLWRISRDKDGCRFVQDYLEAASDADRVTLASEMHSHVWEALRCPNANFVLQKFISVLRPGQASQFILDELRKAGFSKAARHRYGCRVLQRLLEHSGAEQKELFVEDLLADASTLCRHVYGHYVMQHLLEHGSESQVQRLCITLINDLPDVAKDAYGVAVIGSALNYAAGEEQAQLVRILLSTQGLIASIASSRHGHLAAKQALVLASNADRQAALLDLTVQQAHLKSSRLPRFRTIYGEVQSR